MRGGRGKDCNSDKVKICCIRAGFVGNFIYGLTDYPFTLAAWLGLAATGAGAAAADYLGYPLWVIIVAAPIGLAFTLGLTDGEYTSSVVNQEKSESASNHDFISQKSDSDSSGNESIKLPFNDSLFPNEKISLIEKPLRLAWYEKWLFLPFEHFANGIDLFGAPFLILGYVTINLEPWKMGLILAGGFTYAAIFSITTDVTSRNAIWAYRKELRDSENGLDISPKKISLMLKITILGEGIGGFPSYFYAPAQIFDFIAKRFGGFQNYAMGLSKAGIGFGSLPGLLCTLSVMYCRYYYYRGNQTEDEDLPLTRIQKFKLFLVRGAYSADAVINIIIVTLIIADGSLPNPVQLALFGILPAYGLVMGHEPTRAIRWAYGMFNKRKEITQEPSTASPTDTSTTTPGYQSGTVALALN